jgi:chlorobactene glucosyltransferase
MTLLLLLLPWLGVLAFLLFIVRLPTELPAEEDAPDAASAPLVSVIVPARNEEANIVACVRSIVASTYPAFEVIVLDDRSEDGTGELAREVETGNARRVVVLEGAELPQEWLGKPWACRQAAAHAEGELLLFTDADTRHAPSLLGRAVAGLREERADLLTILGRQIMETFWEKIVQPQIFFVMLFRFPDFERTARVGHWRSAIANGQYLLFQRSAYEAIGGHEAVRDEVVEDLALAQHVKRAGLALRIRAAETDLATRMYRSLGDLVAGWSKNILMGGLQTMPPWARPMVAPVSLIVGVGLWLVPPVALLFALVSGGAGLLLTWSVVACALSVVIWSAFSRQMEAPTVMGLLYPLGALVGTYIFLRSWAGGRDVAWKGRRYRLPPLSERP